MNGRADSSARDRARGSSSFVLGLALAMASLAVAWSCTGTIFEPPSAENGGDDAGLVTAAINCPLGELDCGGACTAVASDRLNCGTCDGACGPGEYCNGGVCSGTCSYSVCQGATGPECADTATNARHCGTCGVTCPTGQSCVEGTCQVVCSPACTLGSTCVAGACVCPAGQQACSGACADLSSSPAHCGTCGNGCSTTEICDLGQCVPASAGCSQGLTPCAGSCIDTLSSATHCGQCDVACAPSQSCIGGSCVCPNGGTLCGESCVDVSTSNTHCGSCDVPCTNGQSCVGGSCQCPSGWEWCNGVCVDPLSDNAHCGGCGNACTGGAVCTSGGCACAAPQTYCDGQCIDTEADVSHCGGCGQACFAGEVCTAGRCQGPLGADGCGTAARGLTMTQVAAYQSLKVPLMSDQQEIGAGARTADVVQGRETMFRVFVSVEAGFAPREFSARLTLANGASQDQYFEKRIINGNSTDASTSNTFQILVPADKITVDTRYSVEIVECATASGTLLVPRFPATSDVALGARETGPLKVAIVPVSTNSRLPDTSEATLSVYRNYMNAMYPVTGVELSVTSQITTTYPIDWTNLLVQIANKRQSDGPPSDVYYYGFVKPTDTIYQYCQFSCTAGVGYVASQAQGRAAVGLAYGDETSAATMAHEVGHNHGRDHAPCVPQGSSIDGVDPYYPYAGALLGSWGYDPRTRALLDPNANTDIMGYCDDQWVSDYTYRGFTDRVASVNGAALRLVNPEFVVPYRVLILDAQGPRWGLPYAQPLEPYGDPEEAEILSSTGAVVTRVTVFRSQIADVDAATVLVPEPKAGWHAIRVSGAAAHRFSAPITVPKP